MKNEDILKGLEKHDESEAPLTQLQVGDIIELRRDFVAIVWKVSDCRALCLPLTNRTVEFKDSRTDRIIHFQTSGSPESISPNSEVPILRRLGKSGMISILEKQKNESNEMKEKTEKTVKKEKPQEEAAPKLGRLGGFMGHAITAVIRAMAVAGWEYWECRAAFDAAKVAVADNTIRIQLSAGRGGKGGDPAPLSKKALAEIRPDPSEKSEKEAKPEKKKAAKPAAEKAAKPAKKSKPAPEDDDADDDADEAPVKSNRRDRDEDAPEDAE